MSRQNVFGQNDLKLNIRLVCCSPLYGMLKIGYNQSCNYTSVSDTVVAQCLVDSPLQRIMHPPPADLLPQLLFCGHTIADKWLPIKIIFCPLVFVVHTFCLLSSKMKPLFSFKVFQAKGYRFCVILLICILYYILYYY